MSKDQQSSELSAGKERKLSQRYIKSPDSGCRLVRRYLHLLFLIEDVTLAHPIDGIMLIGPSDREVQLM